MASTHHMTLVDYHVCGVADWRTARQRRGISISCAALLQLQLLLTHGM